MAMAVDWIDANIYIGTSHGYIALLCAVKKLPEHSHVSQMSTTLTTALRLTLNASPSIQFKGNHSHFCKVDVVETFYITLVIFYYVLQNNNVLDIIYWVW